MRPPRASPRGEEAGLHLLHPAVRAWFQQRFPNGPTPAQAAGWPAIASGQDTLIAAPTGSGKTLSAFLLCIDRLYRQADEGLFPAQDSSLRESTHVVYVSPLKALVVDIRQNLEAPLEQIREVARRLGYRTPDIRVATRSGDTTASERARLVRHPPHFLVTTPESLYLMVTAPGSRETLRGIRTVIVDEIHAVARDKRGAHLALTLERLEHLSHGHGRPLRIGLSATQRPIEDIARLLVGARTTADGHPRCAIVDVGHRRELDLAIELPERELEAVASTEQMGEVLDKIARHVHTRRTTLVFVNTRRLSERLAHLLSERLGENEVAAHHGSLSKERRQRVETRLREGSLKALVATASLELGIDVGPVELVCQIGSPRSIATFLQRVGRSGHSRFGKPVGRLYPLTRDELVECTALVRAVREGRLDSITLPKGPLDILAQQIVAECAAQTWTEDELFELIRRSAPYATLSRTDFDSVVALVSEGIVTGNGRRAAFVLRDRVHGELKARRGARLAALTSGGAIPESADYRVVAAPDDTFIGTVNEDFALECMVGDVFLLGSTAWRIRRVERGLLRVVDADGKSPTVPFWLGEAPARTSELSDEVSELRRAIDSELQRGGTDGARRWLESELGVGRPAAATLAEYLSDARAALGLLPTATDIVVERFFDDSGGMQLVLHAPFGARINRGIGLLLRKRFCRSFDFELQAAASDDAIVLSLGPQHSFPLGSVRDFLAPRGIAETLVHAVLPTPIFNVRWRWNLNRALIVLRFKGGKKNPPPIQRMETDDVTASVFPSLTACQDNATGPREIPDHPMVRQTFDDCLHEAIDLDGLQHLLANIAAGRVRLHERDTGEPSALSHEILNSRPYTFLDDAPLEERRTRAVQLRRGSSGVVRELAAIDPRAIERVRAEAMPDPRNADELQDILDSWKLASPREAWRPLFAELVASGRALTVFTTNETLWSSVESRRIVEALKPGARFEPDARLPPDRDPSTLPDLDVLSADVVRGYLDTLGPVDIDGLCAATTLDRSAVELALVRLEGEGFVLRGHFDRACGQEQYCSRRLLQRIHSHARERLRREIEPVTAQDFMRFVLRFQHVAEGTRLSGRAGVLLAIEQLQGVEAAAAAWEPDLLSSRVSQYQSEWLDTLCLSGEAVWGRLSVRSAPTEATRGTTVSRATPITLAIREDFPWLRRAARYDAIPERPAEGSATARLLARLDERGALFSADLCADLDMTKAELADALWDAVARGFITSDGFDALRSLLIPHAAWSTVWQARTRGLRRGVSASVSRQGRWAMLPAPTHDDGNGDGNGNDDDELAEAVAEQLLARWGVVFPELLAREAFRIPRRNLTWAFRRLEARGTIRGGRFVAGFVGEQFALPEAVTMLRTVRDSARIGETVRIAACDPLNLVGIVLPGSRVPAVRGKSLMYRDGAFAGSDGCEPGLAIDFEHVPV